jgi:hypothetical protein
MLKNTLRTIAALALASILAQTANAAPQLSGGAALPAAKSARLAYSPLPPKLRPGIDILLVRDMRQAGGNGGCWNHCYTMFDECMGTSEKNICVTRVKTCMETCDRLSGMANPTQREARTPAGRQP